MIYELCYRQKKTLIISLNLIVIAGGIVATIFDNVILFGSVTFLFILSFSITFMQMRKDSGKHDGELKIPNTEQKENNKIAYLDELENYLDTSIKSKMQVIPVLTEQLQSVINQTDEAAGGLITAFMGISKQAKKQLAEVQDLFGNVTEHATSNNVLSQTQENLKEIQSNFSMITSFFDKSIKMISEVVDQLTKVDSFALNIGNIQKMTNILALNASIQAAHSGKAGEGFKVIATEINTLSRNSNESIKEITEITFNLTKKVNAIKKELETVYQESKEIGQRTDNLFNNTTAKISLSLEDTAEKIKAIATEAESLSKEIGKVVVSIQFQDITRQQIEHVISPLQLMENEFSKLIKELKKREFNEEIKNVQITDTLLEQYTMESEREILKKFSSQST